MQTSTPQPDVAHAAAPPQPLFGYAILGLVAIVIAAQILFSGLGVRTTWARPLARVLVRACLRVAGISVTAHGLEHLPPAPHVLLLNHNSFADPVALIAMLPARPGYAFVTRRQFRSQWLLWPLVHGMGTLVLNHAAGSYEQNVSLIREHLAKGDSLVVFPEGRIPREPGLLKFHSGVFLAAMQAGVPVVPACLFGTRAVLPLGSWLPRRAAISLCVGVPIPAGHKRRNEGDAFAALQLQRAARAEIVRMLQAQA